MARAIAAARRFLVVFVLLARAGCGLVATAGANRLALARSLSAARVAETARPEAPLPRSTAPSAPAPAGAAAAAAAAEAARSPPWDRTLDPGSSSPLLYSQFYERQEALLVGGLGASPLPLDSDLALAVNAAKGARCGSTCYETEHFRKVRMTYFDAGSKVQVFNSLWYPRCDGGLDLPVLGIDLMCFGGAKALAVVDCQPLSGRRAAAKGAGEGDAGATTLSPFAAIRAKYPALCGAMSGRHYDANVFFSDAMLFGRFERDPATGLAAAPPAALEQQPGQQDPIEGELLPAFTEYLAAYLDLVASARAAAVPVATAGAAEAQRARQRAYDQYSADRDPAHALFRGYFGEAWAGRFMHEFLFDGADPAKTAAFHAAREAERAAVAAAGGGHGNPFA